MLTLSPTEQAALSMKRPRPDLERLPPPLDKEVYSCLRSGIVDDGDVHVYLNDSGDFAFLDPLPVTDYAAYKPRVEALGLQAYKQNADILVRRLAKVIPVLEGRGSLLEIGAADGAFLSLAQERFPRLICHAVEPDNNTRPARDALGWLGQYDSLEEAAEAGLAVDVVALFHVFEHLEAPAGMLAAIRKVMVPGGVVLIEVPCLMDPLLSLYSSPAYEAFYFQRQHPYVYSAASLGRVLAHEGFIVDLVLFHQRYGLENHLQWLTAGRPGGNQAYRDLFDGLDADYRKALEREGKTDTVFVTAKLQR